MNENDIRKWAEISEPTISTETQLMLSFHKHNLLLKKGNLFYLVGTGVYLVEPIFSCHWCKTNVITDSHTPLVLSGSWYFIDLPFHSNLKENVLFSPKGHWLSLHAQLYYYKSNETKKKKG